MKILVSVIAAILPLVVASIAHAVPNGAALSVLVQEAVSKGQLPKPILEVMVVDGTELEEATQITVATSISGSYAQGFTFHAICMSASLEQAQRVHDIAIESAASQFKTGVQAEARYSLEQFKQNRCADAHDPLAVGADDVASDDADVDADVVDNKPSTDDLPLDEDATVVLEEGVLEIEERVVTMDPVDDTTITGTVAGGASSSL